MVFLSAGSSLTFGVLICELNRDAFALILTGLVAIYFNSSKLFDRLRDCMVSWWRFFLKVIGEFCCSCAACSPMRDCEKKFCSVDAFLSMDVFLRSLAFSHLRVLILLIQNSCWDWPGFN